MLRLYANENFPREAVEALRALGHDVLTIQEAGQGGQATPDESVLAFAAADKRAVLTLDRRDFIRLHAAHADHAGIIVCTHDADPAAQAERIHQAISEHSSLDGLLLRITRPA